MNKRFSRDRRVPRPWEVPPCYLQTMAFQIAIMPQHVLLQSHIDYICGFLTFIINYYLLNIPTIYRQMYFVRIYSKVMHAIPIQYDRLELLQLNHN